VPDLEQLAGKSFAIILIDYCENTDGDWSVIRGIGKIKDGRLFIDRSTDVDFPIPEDTYGRIKRPTPEIASVVGHAEYYIPLTVGPLPPANKDSN
jgi:hypothetical protein